MESKANSEKVFVHKGMVFESLEDLKFWLKDDLVQHHCT